MTDPVAINAQTASEAERDASRHHLLGQSATVLLTSLDLVLAGRQSDDSDETKLLQMAYDAACEIRQLLTEVHKPSGA